LSSNVGCGIGGAGGDASIDALFGAGLVCFEGFIGDLALIVDSDSRRNVSLAGGGLGGAGMLRVGRGGGGFTAKVVVEA
jgi:hypothetical protein